MNIDQIALCCISMDTSRMTKQALHTTVKLFQISESFFELVNNF